MSMARPVEEAKETPLAEKSVPEMPGVLKRFMSPAFYGFLCSALAELLYSCSYFFLRALTNQQVSSDWTLMIKESVTVTFSIPLILWLMARGKFIFPSRKVILLVLFGSVCVQLLGARSHLWSFTLIGLVLTMPFVQAFQILSTSVIGAFCLRERMNILKVVTMGILIVAVFLLAASQLYTGSGPDTKTMSILSGGMTHSQFWFGVLLTFITGLGYAVFILVLRVVLRENQTRDEWGRERVSTPFVMLLVCGVGVIVGAVSLYFSRGLDGFRHVPTLCWYYALASGTFNYCGLYMRNVGVRYINASTVSFVAVIQVLTLTLVGILVYKEPVNALVWAGLSLSTLGVILTGYNVQKE